MQIPKQLKPKSDWMYLLCKWLPFATSSEDIRMLTGMGRKGFIGKKTQKSKAKPNKVLCAAKERRHVHFAIHSKQSSICCSNYTFNNNNTTSPMNPRAVLWLGRNDSSKRNTINTWGNVAALLQESLLSQATESLILVTDLPFTESTLG